MSIKAGKMFAIKLGLAKTPKPSYIDILKNMLANEEITKQEYDELSKRFEQNLHNFS